MTPFARIFETAAARHGGPQALEALLPRPLPLEAVAATEDHRWLATMARCLFQAGISWKVIDAKWDGFEAAFAGFDPERVAFWHEDDEDRLLADAAIVRHPAKIRAVIRNAAWLRELAAAHGSAARFFAAWPGEDLVGLLDRMGREGDRLGGTTGPRVLRMMGRDGYILTPDVVARLVAEGVVRGAPTSRGDRAAVQAAFNAWAAESGRSLTEISRVLALSIDA